MTTTYKTMSGSAKTIWRCSKRLSALDRAKVVCEGQYFNMWRESLHVVKPFVCEQMIGHDKHKPELPDTDAEDHACDAIAYGCLSRPFVPVKKKSTGDYWRDKRERSIWTY